jgi:hypothetical protein
LDIAIEEPTLALKQIVKTEGFSQAEFSKLLSSYLNAPDPSLFGIVNALTQTAQDYPAERRWEMENIAGRLLDSGLRKPFPSSEGQGWVEEVENLPILGIPHSGTDSIGEESVETVLNPVR